MKKLFVLAFLFLFSLPVLAGSMKIGYVDTIEVFNEYQRTIDQEGRLETEKERVREALEGKEEEIRSIQKKIEVMREAQAAKEREKLQQVMEEYRELRQKELTGVARKRDEMMREIVEDIDRAITNYAQENGYHFILNGNSVLYAPEASNLTDKILSIVNKEYRR